MPRRGGRTGRNGLPVNVATRSSANLSAANMVLKVLVACVVLGLLAAVIAYGTVIASNTSRTRAAVKRIPRSDALGASQITSGELRGWDVVHKFGLNPSVFQTSSTVWPLSGTTPLFLSAAEELFISSDNVQDTAAGGTGARTLRISGIGEDGLEIVEDVDLDGTASVQTTNRFLRLNDAVVVAAGSSNTNEGVITIETLTVLSFQGQISALTSTLQSGFYSLPSNKRAFLTSVQMTSACTNESAVQSIQAYKHNSDGVQTLLVEWGLSIRGTNNVQQDFETPILLEPSSTIEFRATSSLFSPPTTVTVLFTLLTQEV